MWFSVIITVLCFYSPSISSEKILTSENPYTHVQSSNLFCSTTNLKHIICNFNHTNARLGDLDTLFIMGEKKSAKTLRIEITNCSSLWISDDFQIAWRNAFDSLELKISYVESIIQEEITTEPLLKLSSAIDLSIRHSKMTAMFPYLVSETALLMIDMLECEIGVLSAGAFRNVDKMWQLRLFRTNISRIESLAMPDPISLINPPRDIHLQWAPPFIFNETVIGLINADAVKFRITEIEVYLNIVNSHFLAILQRGLKIDGVGHFLVADSIFGRLEHDAMVINLHKAIQNTNSQSPMSFPTLAMMGVEISSTNLTNWLDNLQVHKGKLYLLRMTFRFSGALTSILSYNDRWKISETVFIERWTILCSCSELVWTEESSNTQAIETTTNQIMEEEAATSQFDYEDFAQLPPKEQHTPHSIGWHIRSEIKCYVENRIPLNMSDYQASECSPETVPQEHPTENIEDVSEKISIELVEETGLIVYTSIAGGVLLTMLIVPAVIYFVGIQRKRYIVNKRMKSAPHQLSNNKKHVGVISEDPICSAEDGEDECQL